MKFEKLVDQLRAKIEESRHVATNMGVYFWKDLLAQEFKVPEHEISQAMHVLNLEGLVSLEKHALCSNYGGPKKNKCWHSDYYIVRSPK